MNKQVEAIRQEIERRRDICNGVFERDSDTYYQGKAVAYDEALSFIDSLPKEYEDAVEGEVVQDVYSRELRAKTKDLRKYNLKFGDKIKLIIVKD